MKTNEQVEAELRAALPDELRGEFDDLLRERNELKMERDDLVDDLAKIEKERNDLLGADETAAEMETALLVVKYWLHDFLFLNRTTKSARDILRIVEDGLP